MSKQDDAIKAWVASDPDGVLAAVMAKTVREGSCLVWQGPPPGLVNIPSVGMVLVHRLAYALYRGPDALPAAVGRPGRNHPVVHRLCMNKRCVESWHLARARFSEFGFDSIIPDSWLLPDEPRFKAENRWRLQRGEFSAAAWREEAPA